MPHTGLGPGDIVVSRETQALLPRSLQPEGKTSPSIGTAERQTKLPSEQETHASFTAECVFVNYQGSAPGWGVDAAMNMWEMVI